MPDFLRVLGAAARRWTLYTGFLVLGLGVFCWAGLRSYRLLGDDNESSESTQSGPPRAGGHGGYVHGFNHK
jgi:hypothetical protein